MKDLTIREIQDKKKIAEDKIFETITDFLKETGMTLSDISHDTETIRYLNGTSITLLQDFKLALEV